VETVAITAERQLLEGVFGPLTPEQDRAIRGAIAAMSFDIVDCATHRLNSDLFAPVGF